MRLVSQGWLVVFGSHPSVELAEVGVEKQDPDAVGVGVCSDVAVVLSSANRICEESGGVRVGGEQGASCLQPGAHHASSGRGVVFKDVGEGSKRLAESGRCVTWPILPSRKQFGEVGSAVVEPGEDQVFLSREVVEDRCVGRRRRIRRCPPWWWCRNRGKRERGAAQSTMLTLDSSFLRALRLSSLAI